MNICKNCRYFQLKQFPGYSNTGICLRFPPTQLGMYSIVGFALYPMVSESYSCGEYKSINLSRYEKVLNWIKN